MDLAKVDPRTGSIQRITNSENTTIPVPTPANPESEVNATIHRPSMANADELARILGIASEVGQNISGDITDQQNAKAAGAAAEDFAAGQQNAQQFAKSRAYREAWQYQGAKQLAVQVGSEATQKVSDRLNDSDNPATPQEISDIIEGVFRSHIIGPDGKPVNFGTPKASMVMVNALNEVRANLVPQALAAIKKQTDTRYLSTWADNSVTEWSRGAPIGAKPDPLAPLPGDTTPVMPTSHGAPSVYYMGHPQEPFAGFTHATPNSVMGAPRQNGSRHNGEDYAIPDGTPLVAPLDGKVVASFSNARGGNQVRVQMADGAIVGYAHLSKRDVAVGDHVTAGQAVGLSGQTGDATGPHVHMTVEVNGKKVSPKAYFAGAVKGSLPGVMQPTDRNPVQLASALNEPVPSQLPPFDFEKAMSEVPPGINKGEAKKFLLQSLINKASEKGDIGILAGLEDSKRPDGTPSLSPDEVAVVLKARDEVANNARIDADRAEHDLWKKNGDALLTAMVSGNPPSDDFIAQAAQQRKIDPSMAYTLIQHNKAAAHEAQTEARYEQRQADAEANADYDAFTASEAARLSSGDLSGPTADELWKTGKLGPPGKKAIARYNQLRAGERDGVQRNLQNPLYGQYMGELRMKYGVTTNPFFAPQFGGGQQKINYYGMVAFYKLKVSKGAEPEEAYLETIAKFGNGIDAAQARKQLIKELQAKKAQ